MGKSMVGPVRGILEEELQRPLASTEMFLAVGSWLYTLHVS